MRKLIAQKELTFPKLELPSRGNVVDKAFELAESIPDVENLEEIAMAMKIRSYNASHGTLEGTHCDLCNDKGLIMGISENGIESVTECSCMKSRINELRAKRSGMGGLLSKSLENYETSEPWQKTLLNGARYYIDNVDNDWYCMTGQSGCGKTHLCSAIANHFLKSGKKVIYMPWNIAVKELKLRATDDYTNALQRYIDCEVLYIDDFFKGKVTEADLTIAFELINARAITPNAITIISSERSLSEINDMDSAIAGRIAERCGRYIVNVKQDPEKNYRFKGVQNI